MISTGGSNVQNVLHSFIKNWEKIKNVWWSSWAINDLLWDIEFAGAGRFRNILEIVIVLFFLFLLLFFVLFGHWVHFLVSFPLAHQRFDLFRLHPHDVYRTLCWISWHWLAVLGEERQEGFLGLEFVLGIVFDIPLRSAADLSAAFSVERSAR